MKYNADKTKKIDINRLNIRDNENADYKEFSNISELNILDK